ncbi:MAG: thioredoxin family protein [Mariprofundaceae bacterium]|nr:thioredoxin family protein [Mariprofundaceae bacterium]
MSRYLLTALVTLFLLTSCDMEFGGGGVFRIGQEVPSLKTKTLADAGGDMSKLTSYRYPDARMYQLSFDEALKDGKPIVLEFATPGHCTQCDQQLQLLKVMLERYGDKINFLHMDQYYNPEAYDAFQVRGEPWTFVINAQGKVDYIAPGRVLRAEIEPVLKRVAGASKNG